MATKTVTLKDSNGDTLYPVTDSNVVNINQQKTLAQALDGVVYAEDPTQSATPTAWVTGSDVDWTTTAQSYSTTEVDTGATWIDGKHIYKKTIHGTFSSIPSSGLSWDHNISGLSYIVKIETAFKLGWETAWGNDGFLARAGMAVRVDSAKVHIDTNSSNSYSGAVDVTLWYTKSS